MGGTAGALLGATVATAGTAVTIGGAVGVGAGTAGSGTAGSVAESFARGLYPGVHVKRASMASIILDLWNIYGCSSPPKMVKKWSYRV